MDILRLHETLHHWTVERRAHPGDDFLSFLATAEFDGKLMPVDEVCGNAFLMLAGGVDTTTALLSHTFVHLQQDRAARRFLTEDFSRRQWGVQSRKGLGLWWCWLAGSVRWRISPGGCLGSGDSHIRGRERR